MTTKQLRLVRALLSITTSIVTIAIYTAALVALPGYYDDCIVLRGMAKVFRFISIILLCFGVFSIVVKDTEDDDEEMRYGPVYMLTIYETVCFVYFLSVRCFGYRHFYAFGDNFGLLVSIQAAIIIMTLFVIRSVKHRRLLFENRSWRKKNDNDVVKMLAKAGIVFNTVVLIVIGSVEVMSEYMFKPSQEENGFGCVDLGLKSGTKWADRNLFSTGRSKAGPKARIEGTPLDDDIVAEFLGENWSVPSSRQWNELIGTCKILPSYYKGEYGLTFIGRKKFKRLFIPTPDSGLYSGTVYWTSTISTPYNPLFYDIVCYGDKPISSNHATVQFLSLEFLPWGLIRDGECGINTKCYIRPVMLPESCNKPACEFSDP